jgi:hypothetical protein
MVPKRIVFEKMICDFYLGNISLILYTLISCFVCFYSSFALNSIFGGDICIKLFVIIAGILHVPNTPGPSCFLI